MGTSIILNDVVFSNKNLPLIANLLQDGLVAAFRPTLNDNSMIDLSGNGVKVTKIGNPEFYEGFMRGHSQNGYRIEVPETTSCTLIVVARGGNSLIRNSGVCLPLSSRWDTTDNQRGCSVMIMPTGANTYFYVNNQAFLKSNTAPTTMISKLGGSITRLHDITGASDAAKSEWIFIAVTFDAVSNRITQYAPVKDFEYATINSDSTVSGRRITNLANGQMNRFEICSAAGYTAANGECDVAEALVYNKVLTKEQILEQYALTKDFFAKHRTILI